MSAGAMAAAKFALQRDVRNVVVELIPDGERRGRIYAAKNPRRADRTRGSFVVWLDGTAPGAWKDYASDDHGDIIDLVCFCRGLNRREAMAWAQDRYGLKSMSEAERRSLAERAIRQRETQARSDAERQVKNQQAANLLFGKAWPKLTDTPVAVYLKGRGIDVSLIAGFETRWFRYAADCEYWMGRVRSEAGYVVRKGPRFPAMLAGFVDYDGKQRAGHWTFLTPDGRAKAPVDKAKLIWPQLKAIHHPHIRVSRGRDDLSVEEACANGVLSALIVTEGIEDAMTLALAEPEARVFAMSSLAGYSVIPDYPCISEFIVARDNDWAKRQAAQLFDKAMARLKRFGKPVSVIASRMGKDFNDQWRGQQ